MSQMFGEQPESPSGPVIAHPSGKVRLQVKRTPLSALVMRDSKSPLGTELCGPLLEGATARTVSLFLIAKDVFVFGFVHALGQTAAIIDSFCKRLFFWRT